MGWLIPRLISDCKPLAELSKLRFQDLLFKICALKWSMEIGLFLVSDGGRALDREIIG